MVPALPAVKNRSRDRGRAWPSLGCAYVDLSVLDRTAVLDCIEAVHDSKMDHKYRLLLRPLTQAV